MTKAPGWVRRNRAILMRAETKLAQYPLPLRWL